jgi:hypothetical protein
VIALPKHADEHRPKGPVLLAVDQQLGEAPRLRVPLELADPIGTLEVGESQDVEEFGASGRGERFEASLEARLHLIESHDIGR